MNLTKLLKSSNLNISNAVDHIKRAYELTGNDGQLFDRMLQDTLTKTINGFGKISIPIDNKITLTFYGEDGYLWVLIKRKRLLLKDAKHRVVLSFKDISTLKNLFN
jgi:hypothetical protein